MTKGSGTRSGLLWEVERLLNEVENLPQVLIMENVTQVHGADAINDFRDWISFLEKKGYSNFYEDLNAKDYGVAQNRDRCFMVSILGEWNYKFPQPIQLQKCMKDYLEETVDEKYYITSEKAQLLIDKLILDGKILNGTERNGTERNGTERNGTERRTIDLSINEPRVIERANCIKARYDDGISNFRSDGSGVVEIEKIR